MLRITLPLLATLAAQFVIITESSRLYSEVGCYSDDSVHVALSRRAATSEKMSTAQCFAACQNYFANYFGVKIDQCYCGDTLQSSRPVPSQLCNQRCKGQTNAQCGGHMAMNVYKLGLLAPMIPAPFKGCYMWMNGLRLLPMEMTGPFHVLTHSMCASMCMDKGQSLFGLANGNRCFCGNYIIGGYKVPNQYCKTRCSNSGNYETCGGHEGMEIYAVEEVPVANMFAIK